MYLLFYITRQEAKKHYVGSNQNMTLPTVKLFHMDPFPYALIISLVGGHVGSQDQYLCSVMLSVVALRLKLFPQRRFIHSFAELLAFLVKSIKFHFPPN